MMIDLLKFHANGTRWTLTAVVDGALTTVSGGFIEGFANFDGVDFNGMPIGRTTLAVDMLLDEIEGRNAGRMVPLAVRARSLREAERMFLWEF